MDEITVARCLEQLKQRREVVLRTLQHLENELRQVDENNDWLDYAAYETRVALLTELTDGYLKESQEIDRALTRIAQEHYGVCIACHRPIEAQRLETFPEVEYCAGCKAMREDFAEA